ncbi:MAG TPA: TerB family tellurite resistance protein [Bauldia sp.]|nr:TerB family tellurite resistance protein [Bauldia sp.]
MFESLRRLLSEAARRQTALPANEEELRLASAALLFHVIAVDGIVTEDERGALQAVLEERFGLDDDAADELMSAAEDADDNAVDLYSFTHVLKAALEPQDRERIIEMMWKLVYADGAVHEFEDNAVWRVAELLGVSAEDRIRLKQTVRDHARN